MTIKQELIGLIDIMRETFLVQQIFIPGTCNQEMDGAQHLLEATITL